MKISSIIFLTATMAVFSVVAVRSEIINCKVVSARKDKVVIDCGSKAATLKPGDTVKVRYTSRRLAPLMGC